MQAGNSLLTSTELGDLLGGKAYPGLEGTDTWVAVYGSVEALAATTFRSLTRGSNICGQTL